jgi:hypothetical protein
VKIGVHCTSYDSTVAEDRFVGVGCRAPLTARRNQIHLGGAVVSQNFEIVDKEQRSKSDTESLLFNSVFSICNDLLKSF